MQSLFDKDALQNVNYIGSVPYNNIQHYISSATVCVFPTFAEALPVSWIEAMAMQKAIVASNIGWATEVIDDTVNGFLVYPKNHKQFAAKVLELLENNEMRNQFGIAARKKVEQKFSMEVVAKQSVKFYQKVNSSKNI
jgi:glycosyltransferase involved in cell wall biosynthesis